MCTTEKEKLARAYAILKRAVWKDEGVLDENNDIEAHYKIAMKFKTIKDLEEQNERLTIKLCDIK